MPNRTLEQNERCIKVHRKLLAHMEDVYTRNPSQDYANAMDRLRREIKAHEEELSKAYEYGWLSLDRDIFVLWPPSEEVRLSRGRAGDVDPGGVMTQQGSMRGYTYVKCRRVSVSNGEW